MITLPEFGRPNLHCISPVKVQIIWDNYSLSTKGICTSSPESGPLLLAAVLSDHPFASPTLLSQINLPEEKNPQKGKDILHFRPLAVLFHSLRHSFRSLLLCFEIPSIGIKEPLLPQRLSKICCSLLNTIETNIKKVN